MRLVSVLHDLLVCDTTSKDKRDELQKYVKTPCRLLHVVIQHFVFVRRLYLTLTSLAHTHTLPFNGPFSGTTQVSQYQKGKTNLDFTEARDSEWQWH